MSNCESTDSKFAIRDSQLLSAPGEIRTHHCPVSKTGDSYQLVYEGINGSGETRTSGLSIRSELQTHAEEAVRLELTTDLAATRVQAVLFIQPDRLQTMRAGFEPASELPETP